ncbi:MAG: DoxX family protein [Chloroflexi bacterium]|nr:MAG: DoxX family protein [Chloroflexota bacterium]
MMAVGLLILRLVVGLTIAGHGAQKLFGWWGGPGMTGWTQMVTKLRIRPAEPWAWIAALAEFGGGILLALGLLTPLAAVAIAGSMIIAIATVHLPRGFWVTKGGYEYNLAVLATMASLSLTGPGTYSLDQVLGIHFPQPLTVIIATIALIVGVSVTLVTRSPQQAQTESKPQTT